MATSPCLTILSLSAALVAVAVGRSGWLASQGVERTALEEPPGMLMMKPDVRCAIHSQRFTAKSEMIDRLEAGELDLFEAASWFHHLNQNPPEFADCIGDLFPGQTEEEKLCRQVIVWVKHHHHGKLSDGLISQKVARLEAELTARLDCCGRIDLPAWR